MPGSDGFEKLHITFEPPQQVVISAEFMVLANRGYQQGG
jgi:hypothetical protein